MRMLRARRRRVPARVRGRRPAPGSCKHLSTYKIGREVEVADRSAAPRARLADRPALARARRRRGARRPSTSTRDRRRSAGPRCLAVATDLGIDLLTSPADAAGRPRGAARGGRRGGERRGRRARSASSRAARASAARWAPRRCPPRPGIVERAVDFEKGCYIGQEPVARLHYRGRPNRLLRGLRPRARRRARRGGRATATASWERSATACGLPQRSGRSPSRSLRREAEPGDTVKLAGGGEAEVVELPFDPAEPPRRRARRPGFRLGSQRMARRRARALVAVAVAAAAVALGALRARRLRERAQARRCRSTSASRSRDKERDPSRPPSSAPGIATFTIANLTDEPAVARDRRPDRRRERRDPRRRHRRPQDRGRSPATTRRRPRAARATPFEFEVDRRARDRAQDELLLP